MNLALTLLITALQLKVSLLGLPAQYQSLRDTMLPQVDSAISFAQQLVATPTPQTVDVTPITPVFGAVATSSLPVNQPIMDNHIECTLTAESNVMPPSSMVNLTWTSTNAVSATIRNSRVDGDFKPLNNDGRHPISGSTQGFLMSSESGENNVFTIRFVDGQGLTKDCEVSVMTQ